MVYPNVKDEVSVPNEVPSGTLFVPVTESYARIFRRLTPAAIAGRNIMQSRR